MKSSSGSSSAEPPLRLSCSAMATRFELVLPGGNPIALRAAGEEALAEIERLEDQLSLYRDGSEIAQINRDAAHHPVRVTPAVFKLLQHAQQLHQQTEGAFDITIAPLVRCWGFMGRTEGRRPTPEEIASARELVGMRHVHLEASTQTVSFAREGVMLDLGAIGKGYAIESAAELLREAGVTSALLHGGTSTVYALGHPPDASHWKVALDEFPKEVPFPVAFGSFELCDEAISVSAIWGRSFSEAGKLFGHVLDPRTGWPATEALLGAVIVPSATESDALSTALLISGRGGHDRITALRPGMKTLLVVESDGKCIVATRGLSIHS